MFRYVCDDQLTRPGMKEWGLSSSQHLPPCPTLFRAGKTSLLRQKSFKFERLIPVFSTQFVLLVVPITAKQSSDEHHQYASKILALFRLLQSLLPVDCPLCIREVVSDPFNSLTLVVADVFEPRNTVDLYTAIDELMPARWLMSIQSEGELASEANDSDCHRRIVAFPFDAEESSDLSSVAELYFQLPSCLLCCDRLDRTISGIVGRICNCEPNEEPSSGASATLCKCFSQSSCVVCRTTAIALNMQDSDGEAQDRVSVVARCHECNCEDDTWICLVCGIVGCSRYRESHVQRHCESACHDFSMSLASQQIWDYVSDRFVHRIFIHRNTATGIPEKLHFPEADGQLFDEFHSNPDAAKKNIDFSVTKIHVDPKLDGKIQDLCLLYSRKLAAHMTTQRLHFQALLDQLAPALQESLPTRPRSVGHGPDSLMSVSEYSRFVSASLESSVPVSLAETELRVSALLKKKLEFKEKVELLTEESKKLETEQESLKQQFRAKLLAEAAEKERLEIKIRNLEESIADAKSNLRLMQQVRAAGGSSGSMAVLGTARTTVTKRRR